MTINAVQVIGVFYKVPFNWPSEYRHILKAMSVLILDLSIFNVDCAIGSSAAKYFNQVIFFFWVLMLLPAVGLLSQVIPKTFEWWRWTKARLINVLGAFTSIVFVTMISVAQIPINCYSHPNDLGRSVRAYPDIICGDGGSHNTMLLCCCALFLLAVSFYAACVFATVVAPQWSADKATGNEFLVATRFLFIRYRVEAWYWGIFLLMRSVLIALTPTFVPDEPHAQLIIFCAIFTFFIAMHMRLWPWKVPILNVVEVVIMAMLLLTVTTASSESGFNGPFLFTYLTFMYLGAQMVIVIAGMALVRNCTMDFLYLGKPPDLGQLSNQLALASNSITETERPDLLGLLEKLPVYDLQHIAQAVEVMRQVGIPQSPHRIRGSSRRISFGHQLSDPSNKVKGDATSLEEISFGFRQSGGSSQNSKDIQPPVTNGDKKQMHEWEVAV